MPNTTGYVTDLREYEGPVDRISNYHFYMHKYWTLRGQWRRKLYAWTRREPCDASAAIDPDFALAGNRRTLTLTVTAGATPFAAGARITVYFPIFFGGAADKASLQHWQGPDGQIGYGSRIVAEARDPNVRVTTIVHSTGTVFTCVEAVIESGTVAPGDAVCFRIGDPVCKLPVLGDAAKSYPLRVAVDYSGDDTFRPVLPTPVLRIGGNRAVRLRCVAPATPPPGTDFPVRIVALDSEGNASFSYQGTLEISAESSSLSGPETATASTEAHGSIALDGFRTADRKATRIRLVDWANGLSARSNPICPEAAPAGLALYYGEIHSHTELSDGGGLPEDSYRWARDVEGLDFSALADHFEDGQSYNYTLEDKWEITRRVAEQFNNPGTFVSLLGYEIGTLERHRNVYFPDAEGRMIVQGADGETVTMDNVYDKLAGTDYLLIPHAPKFHGIDWRAKHVPERQRLVEICSNWGISEAGGPKSVRHALDLGLKLGFTGGTDNHAAEPGAEKWGGGITAVFAPELTRRAIFDALVARRTVAIRGERMIVTFAVNGVFMGEEGTSRPGEARCVQARVIASDPIQEVRVIRNGEEIYTLPGNGREDVTLNWEDQDTADQLIPVRELTDERFMYYYLRVETVNGGLAWASPVWIHV
jgi:hypothetical protein